MASRYRGKPTFPVAIIADPWHETGLIEKHLDHQVGSGSYVYTSRCFRECTLCRSDRTVWSRNALLDNLNEVRDNDIDHPCPELHDLITGRTFHYLVLPLEDAVAILSFYPVELAKLWFH